jgi:hypothetical protein
VTNIDGLKSQVLLEAAYESIDRGTKVNISNESSAFREDESVNIHPAHR